MKKFVFVLFTLIVCLALPLSLFAEEKKSPLDGDEPPGFPTVTLTRGGCSASVDTFARSFNYNVGAPCGNIMSSHQDFISINDGPVASIDQVNCTIVNPITLFDTNFASNTIQCGNLTITYNHSLSGPPLLPVGYGGYNYLR